jgi:O-antigen ligase
VSIASIAQRYLGSAVVSEQWKAQAGAVRDVSEEQLGEILRTTGTFSHPAWLGLFLSVTIPLTLYTWATARRYSLALLALGFVVIEVLGVFSTYSRMAYIGAALGIALFMVRRRFGPLLLGLAATGAVVLFPVLPEDFQVRARSILDYDESSSSLTRIGQQIAGWRLILAHPLFGVGPGNFEDEVIQYRSGIGAPFRVEPIGAHNLYVEVAAELGLVGLLLLLYLIGCIWLDARRLRRAAVERNDDRSALFWECVGIGFVVFLVSALFVHAQYRKEWWLIAALVAAGRVLTAQRRANPQFETPRSGTSESNP